MNWSLNISKSDDHAAILAEIPHLRRYALALLRESEAADDLVQDGIQRALSKLHLFQSGTNMRAWLMTILHNLHIQQARSRNRAIDDVALEPDMENRVSRPPDQEDGLYVRELSRALDALEDQHREIILMIGLSGLSYKQTAEALEIPVGTVMSRLARGRERLRVLMSEGATPTLRRVK